MANCPTEIIGVKKIALYINNGARFERPDTSVEDEVNLIVTESENFLLTDLKSQMKWERVVSFSGNYKQNYFDEFTFLLHGVQNEIPELIRTLRSNRLGYIIEIITAGNKSFVFQSPIFLNTENTKQVDSHSWNISLSYRIPSFLNKLTLLDVTIGTQPEEITNNIEIVGIQKMSLYINEGVVFRYLNPSNENEIALISPVEPFIIINDFNQLPKWERTIDNSDNYKQDYKDEFSFLLHGIENDVPEIIQSLRNNRLGFIVEILTTGNKPFIFRTPVFLNEDNTKQIDSHSWGVNLSYRTPSFKDKLTLTERPIVEYRNGIVTNSFFGEVAVFDFEAKINSNIQVTFTINWGADIGTTVINSTLVDGVWKALQTSIEIPLGVDPNQTINVTDNFGDSFEVEYVIEVGIPDGIVGMWMFIGDAKDTSGNGNDGTVFGATLVPDHNGNPNSAFSFSGSDWIDIGDVLDMGLSDWSISTRINTAFINTSGIVFKGDSPSVNSRYGIITISGSLLGFIQPGSAISTAVAAGSGTKYVTVTYDRSGLMTLYVDNVLVNSVSISSGEFFDMNSVDGLAFGSFSNGSAKYTGTIDFVRIYNKLIDTTERARDMAL